MNDSPLLRRPETREMRVQFATPPSLVAGLARARQEPWVRSARIDWANRELVVSLAGGSRSHLRVVDGHQVAA